MDNKLLSTLQNIFREVFEDDTLIVSPTTASKDIEAWDSLNHIQLIAEIEDEFDIQFELNDVVSFEKVEDIINSIVRLL